jgi:glutathione S-transferase
MKQPMTTDLPNTTVEPVLFGSTDSGHSYKVRLYLLLQGLRHRYVWVDLQLARDQRGADFQQHSAYGEVPVWVDGGLSLSQSNAILIHLAQQTGRMAGEAGEWPLVLQWLSWEANCIGFSVPNLRFARHWAPQPRAVMDYLRDRAQRDLQALNQHLADRRFLLPSGPTIADISCSAYLHWLHQIDVDEAHHPHISAWLGRLRALDGWQHPDVALRADR